MESTELANVLTSFVSGEPCIGFVFDFFWAVVSPDNILLLLFFFELPDLLKGLNKKLQQTPGSMSSYSF